MTVLHCDSCVAPAFILKSTASLCSLVCSGCSRAASGAVKDKEPLKKAKTPQGRFDIPEEKSKDVLQSEKDAGDFLSLNVLSVIWQLYY